VAPRYPGTGELASGRFADMLDRIVDALGLALGVGILVLLLVLSWLALSYPDPPPYVP
jgi:hypothetical protein